MDALIVIDMQEGPLANSDKYDLDGVVARINQLAGKVRATGGKVVFIQHDGTAAEDMEPGTYGWQVLSTIKQDGEDLRISKSTNDSFYSTLLQEKLVQLGATRLIICGWATDQCVDSTVRAAISRDFDVMVASDCHTVSDRPAITAEQVIAHHNGIWAHLMTPGEPVNVLSSEEIVSLF